MEEQTQPLDAVRMMREIRDALSEEIRGMSTAEQLALLRESSRTAEAHASVTAKPRTGGERGASSARSTR